MSAALSNRPASTLHRDLHSHPRTATNPDSHHMDSDIYLFPLQFFYTQLLTFSLLAHCYFSLYCHAAQKLKQTSTSVSREKKIPKTGLLEQNNPASQAGSTSFKVWTSEYTYVCTAEILQSAYWW